MRNFYNVKVSPWTTHTAFFCNTDFLIPSTPEIKAKGKIYLWCQIAIYSKFFVNPNFQPDTPKAFERNLFVQRYKVPRRGIE